MGTDSETIDAEIDRLAEFLQFVRRDLHAHPELSSEEYRTTEVLAGHLAEAGIPYRIAPSGRGLIAGPSLEASDQPVIAIRADIDALPLQEAPRDIPYRSRTDGKMHACGHDAHSAMALGAALALHRFGDRLPRPNGWRVIFQPAEEIGQGAAEMINAGAMEGVSAIVAQHVDPEFDVGQVALRRGPLTACCQELRVEVRGRGGHAARPHQAIDPIAAAVQFVSAVYQAVPRAIDARSPTVVTFGSILGEGSYNVIPDQVRLLGGVRTVDSTAKQQVEATLQRLANGVAAATGTEIEIQLTAVAGSVINDPVVTEAVAQAATKVVGAEFLAEIPHPSLGGEDFAHYLDYASGCMFRLGVASGPRPRPALHSTSFDIDERALVFGSKVLARSVLELSSRSNQGQPTVEGRPSA